MFIECSDNNLQVCPLNWLISLHKIFQLGYGGVCGTNMHSLTLSQGGEGETDFSNGLAKIESKVGKAWIS